MFTPRVLYVVERIECTIYLFHILLQSPGNTISTFELDEVMKELNTDRPKVLIENWYQYEISIQHSLQ